MRGSERERDGRNGKPASNALRLTVRSLLLLDFDLLPPELPRQRVSILSLTRMSFIARSLRALWLGRVPSHSAEPRHSARATAWKLKHEYRTIISDWRNFSRAEK